MMHLALACKFVEPINELGVAASLIDDRLRVRKKLAQLAGEPGQVLGGSQYSGPVAFGECLARRSPSKRERDALSPARFQT